MEVTQIEGIECGVTPSEIVNYLGVQVPERLEEWGMKMKEAPESFAVIEKEILQFGKIISGILTVSILANSETQNRIKAAGKEIPQETGRKWRYVKKACLTLTLLCGLAISISTPYLLPRKDSSKCGRPRGTGKRGKEGSGIYPELAVLGIREGVTSSLQEEVARTTIFLTSFELSRQELSHRGIELDVKTVRRITLELGEQALAARTAGAFPFSRSYFQKRKMRICHVF